MTPAGHLSDAITGFARALRRAGLPVDSARIALAQQAAVCVGVDLREDFCAALETVLVQRESDRALFLALFDAWFQAPELALGDGVATDAARDQADSPLDEASAPSSFPAIPPKPPLPAVVGVQASAAQRLERADFNALNEADYALVQALARQIPLVLPTVPGRRMRAGARGARLHWPGVMQAAARNGGEVLHLPRLQRRAQTLPLLVLVDVSASMARYARLLLAFLHAATRGHRARQVFAFGTDLSSLNAAFALPDGDAMLAACTDSFQDFAGGTHIGQSLASLRTGHARSLIGRRTVVLLVSDGLDTGAAEVFAQELAWLRRHSRSLLWLNPLLRFDAYAPTACGPAVLSQHVDAMQAVHNLHSLRELASNLARLLELRSPTFTLAPANLGGQRRAPVRF